MFKPRVSKERAKENFSRHQNAGLATLRELPSADCVQPEIGESLTKATRFVVRPKMLAANRLLIGLFREESPDVPALQRLGVVH
jgi:hypothetical protein